MWLCLKNFVGEPERQRFYRALTKRGEGSIFLRAPSSLDVTPAYLSPSLPRTSKSSHQHSLPWNFLSYQGLKGQALPTSSSYLNFL